MKNNEKAQLFEQVVYYGFSEMTRQLINTKAPAEVLATLPAMATTILMVQSTPYAQLTDGRIFKHEELTLGPNGELVVRQELEMMMRKIEQEMKCRAPAQ
jgi:hypothetical protein